MVYFLISRNKILCRVQSTKKKYVTLAFQGMIKWFLLIFYQRWKLTTPPSSQEKSEVYHESPIIIIFSNKHLGTIKTKTQLSRSKKYK